MKMNNCISFIFLLLFTGYASAVTPTPITLDSTISKSLLAPHAMFYKDVSDEPLSITDIISKHGSFQPLLPKDINQGFSDQAFWIKLNLSNPSSKDITWVISHETSYLDEMNIYIRDESDDWRNNYATDHADFSQRSLPYRRLNFSATTSAYSSSEVFIKLQMINKDALTLGLTIQSKDIFNKAIHDEQFFYGIYFGIILTLITISLIFSSKVREKLYFVYTIYLFMHLVLWGYLTGYIFQYVIPNSPVLFNQGFNIAFLVFFMSALQFSKQFLNTEAYSPNVHKLLSALQVFALLAIGLRLLGVYELVVNISHISLLSLVLLPIVGWQSYRQGFKYARWYIIAWAIFGTGILLSVLSASTNLFDWGMEPMVYTQIASLFESFLLMLALADKVNQVNNDLVTVTNEVQQDALTQLGNRRLLESTYKEMALCAETNTSKKYWCLVLDIDNFKLLNDKHGHAFGDEVLKRIASIFKRLCRPEDLVIRYGGEEFVILIESSDVNIVKYIAERIRMNVESAVLKHQHVEVRTTISIGISAVSLDKNKPFELSFKKADQALYHVKRNKKNGIALYQDSEIIPL